MNYDEFINNILETRGRFACGDEYHERHHIVPRCMGGTDDDDNLIDLFAREHFEAHRLLALENPENDSLIYAWWAMCQFPGSSKKREEVTAEEYEEVRIKFATLCSEKYRGEGNPMYGIHRFGKESPTYGKVWTEEERKRASEAQIKSYKEHPERWKRPEGFNSGEKNPNFGKHLSEETKKKISIKNKEYAAKNKKKKQEQWVLEKHCCEMCGKQMYEKYGSGRFCSKECVNAYISESNKGNSYRKDYIFSEEAKRKMGEAHKGYAHSEETKKKISKALTGRKHSEETKKKISESRKGKESPTKGIPRSEETKRKISESRKGKYAGENSSFYGKQHSEETKRKLSKSHSKAVRCIETGVIYYGATEAAKQTGFDRAGIGKCCNGKQETAGGYHWEFVEEPTQ